MVRRCLRKAHIWLLIAALNTANLSWATELSDTPIWLANSARPNVFLALDDSDSMDWEVLLPSHDGAGWFNITSGKSGYIGFDINDNYLGGGVLNFNSVGNYNYSGNKSNTIWYRYGYLFPNGAGTGGRAQSDDQGSLAIPPLAQYAYFRAAEFNPQYYNPSITYQPWQPVIIGGNKVSFSDISVVDSVSPVTAPFHPLYGNAGSLQLNADFSSSNLNFNANGWTFRMVYGMTVPSGASYRMNGVGPWQKATSAVPIASGDFADVAVDYYPATYYLRCETCTADAYGPDGKVKLKKYEIKAGNSFPSGRTYQQEMQNFANWFSYHRKRQYALNAALGSALTDVSGIKVAYTRFNDLSINPGLSSSYQVASAMLSMSDTVSKQALLGAIYQTQPAGGTAARAALNYVGSQLNSNNKLIAQACEQNSALVVSDGFALNSGGPAVGNIDGQSDNHNPAYTGVAPYTDNFNNTLGDIAAYWYKSRLRAASFQAGQVPENSGNSCNPDKNPDLHMNTYALGFGLTGNIFGTGSAAALNPYPTCGGTAPVWADPIVGPASVDDLWHATINGRGNMLPANDASSLRQGLVSLIDNFQGKAGAMLAAGLSSTVISGNGATSYIGSFNTGSWHGDLQAYPVAADSGAVNLAQPLWSASSKLDKRTATNRFIATHNGTTAVALDFNNLSLTQKTAITSVNNSLWYDKANSLDGASFIAWLRGDRSKEGSVFRSRSHLLGAPVNAEPVLSGGNVYLATNDGMLHAFSASTGEESWAYVPGFILASSVNPIHAYGARFGFQPKPYLDATPTVANVTINGAAKTILIGGTGKGGFGYYALDITQAGAASDADVANKVLWEYTSPNLGNSFAKPALVKTKTGKWLALMSSGYNNGAGKRADGSDQSGGDGRGHLFVRDLDSGATTDIATTVGSTSDPSGLGPLAAFVNDPVNDPTVQQVYAGDLKGNVWRFDLASWPSYSVSKLATLVDGSGSPQPVTTSPELATLPNNGGRIVYVGTGRYLGVSDIALSTPQSMYGLIDNMSGAELNPLRSQLVKQTVSAGTIAGNLDISTNAIGTKRGWYFDFTGTGERMVSNPSLALGALVFTTIIPNTDPCGYGGISYLYAVNYQTGGKITNSTWTAKRIANGLASRPSISSVVSSGKLKATTQSTDGKVITTDLPISNTTSVRRVMWTEIVR